MARLLNFLDHTVYLLLDTFFWLLFKLRGISLTLNCFIYIQDSVLSISMTFNRPERYINLAVQLLEQLSVLGDDKTFQGSQTFKLHENPRKPLVEIDLLINFIVSIFQGQRI